MKKLIILILTLLYFTGYSQTNSVKLKSFTISSSDGKTTEIYKIIYNSNLIEKVTGKQKNWSFKYDILNNLTEIIEKGSNGTVTKKITFIYNQSNQLIEQNTYYQGRSFAEGNIVYAYNGNKLVQIKDKNSAKNRKTTIIWNGDNVSSVSESDAVSVYYTKTFQYNLLKENKLNSDLPILKYIFQNLNNENLPPFEFFMGKNEVVQIELQNLYKSKKPYSISAFTSSGYPKSISIGKLLQWNPVTQTYIEAQTFPVFSINFNY